MVLHQRELLLRQEKRIQQLEFLLQKAKVHQEEAQSQPALSPADALRASAAAAMTPLSSRSAAAAASTGAARTMASPPPSSSLASASPTAFRWS